MKSDDYELVTVEAESDEYLRAQCNFTFLHMFEIFHNRVK